MWLCVVLVARPISVGQSRALARACKMFVKHFHDEAVLRSSDDINFAFRLRYHLLISRCVIICYRQTILDFVWYFFLEGRGEEDISNFLWKNVTLEVRRSSKWNDPWTTDFIASFVCSHRLYTHVRHYLLFFNFFLPFISFVIYKTIMTTFQAAATILLKL